MRQRTRVTRCSAAAAPPADLSGAGSAAAAASSASAAAPVTLSIDMDDANPRLVRLGSLVLRGRADGSESLSLVHGVRRDSVLLSDWEPGVANLPRWFDWRECRLPLPLQHAPRWAQQPSSKALVYGLWDEQAPDVWEWRPGDPLPPSEWTTVYYRARLMQPPSEWFLPPDTTPVEFCNPDGTWTAAALPPIAVFEGAPHRFPTLVVPMHVTDSVIEASLRHAQAGAMPAAATSSPAPAQRKHAKVKQEAASMIAPPYPEANVAAASSSSVTSAPTLLGASAASTASISASPIPFDSAASAASAASMPRDEIASVAAASVALARAAAAATMPRVSTPIAAAAASSTTPTSRKRDRRGKKVARRPDDPLVASSAATSTGPLQHTSLSTSFLDALQLAEREHARLVLPLEDQLQQERKRSEQLTKQLRQRNNAYAQLQARLAAFEQSVGAMAPPAAPAEGDHPEEGAELDSSSTSQASNDGADSSEYASDEDDDEPLALLQARPRKRKVHSASSTVLPPPK